MDGGALLKRAGLLFLAVLGCYVLAFAFDQHLRTRRGPWEIAFERGADGEPVLRIEHPGSGVSNVTLVVRGERMTNEPGVVRFDFPGKELRYGEKLFEDLTYQPGTLAFELAGHEVELLPRVLTVDRREYDWRPGLRIELRPEDRPPPRPGKRSGRS